MTKPSRFTISIPTEKAQNLVVHMTASTGSYVETNAKSAGAAVQIESNHEHTLETVVLYDAAELKITSEKCSECGHLENVLAEDSEGRQLGSTLEINKADDLKTQEPTTAPIGTPAVTEPAETPPGTPSAEPTVSPAVSETPNAMPSSEIPSIVPSDVPKATKQPGNQINLTKKIVIKYIKRPTIAVKKKKDGKISYLEIVVKKYKGKYIDLYYTTTGKRFKKITKKKLSIKKFKGKFKIRLLAKNSKIGVKARTWMTVKKKKRYSKWSVIKWIRI